MESFLRMTFSGIETGSFYALAALGIIIIFRTSITTNFAQGVIGMFNAYAANYFYEKLGYSTIQALILAIITAIIMGIVIDIVIIRQAKKVNPVGKQIITLGLIMVITGFTPILYGTDAQEFGRLIPKGSTNIGPVSLSHNSILNMGLVLGILLLLFFLLQKTKLGLAVRVTASSEPTAKLMGVPTKMVTMAVWALAAALSTLAALMLAPNNKVEIPMMNNVQVNALIACVLGGFQTFYGPVIAAYIIGIASNLIVFYVNDVWGEPLLYMLILTFILFRPYGLIGKKYVKKV